MCFYQNFSSFTCKLLPCFDTVDQILTEGDVMYVKDFDDGTIPDTETLSLTHLPDRVRWPTVTVGPAKLNQLLTARQANTRLKSKAKD